MAPMRRPPLCRTNMAALTVLLMPCLTEVRQIMLPVQNMRSWVRQTTCRRGLAGKSTRNKKEQAVFAVVLRGLC
ncbi:uncharacterized protein SPSK_06813 [Sporothrix schenckii 1099-18]|uniref:Secreted protein n=1 Tax=Sporothrix schenckii 1099-18 TaxID=1397361 RepID=A0A0F2MJL7_SPOSC|nr:uncharacterized protein SPSK_06813 [Sporothrix schenckii 1099-18]KJR89259.1 hypothetical protein SPSK_06813 [Sporothrix schenckii 1099-18]